VHTGGRRERNVLQPRVDGVDGRRADLVQLLRILAAADRELEELAPIEQRDERVLVLYVEPPDPGDQVTDVDAGNAGPGFPPP
jgi:hypothetical protein